jgi:hypothetical protein
MSTVPELVMPPERRATSPAATADLVPSPASSRLGRHTIVKNTFSRWLPAIARNRAHAALVGIAGLTIVGGIAAGPAPDAAGAASEGPAVAATKSDSSTVAKSASTRTKVAAKAQKAAPAKKVAAAKTLKHSTTLQPNYYFCGPAATHNALTALGSAPSMYKLAEKMGTTTAGTNSAHDITRALNAQVGEKRYKTTEISGQKATAQQIAQLKADVVASISDGDPIVANIAGTVTDKAGDVHSYEGGHYIAVVGYSDKGETVTIADSADAVGSPEYKLSTKTLAHWIATRGYSS